LHHDILKPAAHATAGRVIAGFVVEKAIERSLIALATAML
jgi:hypothetical protein